MGSLHHAYLLLGSNIGDRAAHFDAACKRINSDAGRILKTSSLYETEPWGVTGQPNYLNAAIKIETQLAPISLLSTLKQIEIDEGRTDQKKYAPRILDIDILFYDNLAFNSKELVIPHPKIHLRRFALVPMNEIEGELIHPVFQKSIAQLLNECNDTLRVTRLERA